jgi:para-aminobenzoate synthetase component 1
MSTAGHLLARDLAPPAELHLREVPYAEPLELLAPFAGDPHAALLESAVTGRHGRFSFVAPEPFQVMTARDGRVEVDGRAVPGDPFAALRRELARFPVAAEPGIPFSGGAVGYLGYELGRHLERVPVPERDDLGLPDLALLFCDVVIAVDHRERRAWICSSGHPEPEGAARRERAAARARAIEERLRSAAPLGPPAAPRRPAAVTSSFTRRAYEAAVAEVIERILAGDIFQANLSQRFAAELPEGLGPLDLYRRLRERNPAPFASFLKLGDAAIASSSPERFLRLAGRRATTSPIKGTRPRDADPERDRALADELLASAKDRAENVMIVDLLRNDLSRVCRDGSVEVPGLCRLERFATVHHLVSTVTGDLRPGLTAVDLLAACFPGGSITGAPKIRAMEIIAELEPTRRGPYCGAIGYLGFDGAMDSSIVIRTFAMRGGRVTFNAGGGIVADSDPAAEYDETMSKAAALLAALGGEPPA